MGDWNIILPEATTNLCTNPSAETNTTGWVADAGAIASTTDRQRFGARAFSNTPTVAVYDGVRYAVTLTAATEYTVSVWVKCTPSVPYRLFLYDETAPAVLGTPTTWTGDGEWTLYEQTATTGANTSCSIRITKNNNASVGTWYFDAVQLEQKGYSTTYCDGDQEGCEWIAAPHGSTSRRSAQSRAGGRVYDLIDDYSLKIGTMSSSGMVSVSQILDEFALAPGGEVQGFKEHSRMFILGGLLQGTTTADLHAQRQALISALAPHSVPDNQPLTIRYTGAAVDKEIRAYYDGGLELNWDAAWCSLERVALRFLAADPYWYEVGNSAAVLDSYDTPTLRYITARLKDTGQWDDLGLTANPTANGTIYAIAYNPVDGKYYVGGQFSALDTDGDMDNIARYDPATGAFEAVGAGSAVSSTVYALAVAPNGDVYAGGLFTALGGANGDRLAYYDLSGDAWAVPGDPKTGATLTSVTDLAFGRDGTLYIVGDFDNLGAVAAADGIATWDGTSYGAVGAPAGLTAVATYPFCVGVDSNDNVYVGGTFTAANGAADDYLVYWNGTAWGVVGTFDNFVYRIYVLPNDDVIFGGPFTNVGDANGDRIVKWNGQGFSSFGTGLNSTVYDIEQGPDGILYVSGAFTAAGSLGTVNRLAKWTGASWAHLDIGSMGTVEAIATGPADPVVPTNYDVWVGGSASAAVPTAGSVTVTNSGTANAYPVITINRSGGTTATLTNIRNETTGKILLFNYSLLADETLTINTDPKHTLITSSFFGRRMDAILKTSDFGEWFLQPGANQITCLVGVVGAPTVTALMTWRDPYLSVD